MTASHVNKIILCFVVPNIVAFQYDDHVETQSGQKFENVGELIKIYTKKRKEYIKKYSYFIKFALKEFNNVTQNDIIKALEKNKNDYGSALYDLVGWMKAQT